MINFKRENFRLSSLLDAPRCVRWGFGVCGFRTFQLLDISELQNFSSPERTSNIWTPYYGGLSTVKKVQIIEAHMQLRFTVYRYTHSK